MNGSQDRREAVRNALRNGKPFINGIDFLEVDPANEANLVIHFIHNLPDAPVDPVPGIVLTRDDIAIQGGERITSFTIVAAVRTANDQLTITVDKIGDFSVYTLTLRLPNGQPPGGYDPQLCAVQFVFHVECAKQFDCKPQLVCPPEFVAPPAIDYMARDYPGFLRAMLDRMALLAPAWQERNAADLGVAVVEVLAYVADHLSYRQDVIATEAYLGTARLRTSVRRHARLVDYHLSEGLNARAWLRLIVNADLPAGIDQSSRIRFATSFATQTPPFLVRSPASYRTALMNGAEFFEPMGDTPPLFVAHNEIPLYNWSARSSCLAVGATHATLEGPFPNLKRGMVLVLAESRGPQTGSSDDADPSRRWAVRLISNAVTATDPVTGTAVTEIDWHPADALPFSICVSSITDPTHGSQPITHVSVAWGNIVLADHGRTLGDPLEQPSEAIGTVSPRLTQRFRPGLAEGPLTFAAANPYADESVTFHSAADAIVAAGAAATAAITVSSRNPDRSVVDWHCLSDLLAVEVVADTAAFVVEVENDGTAYLRFGDGTNGRKPEPGARFCANYRTGLGTRGNVGRDTIVLIDALGLPAATQAALSRVTNPLPAWGGVEPETIGHVRQSAPYAFRTQARAVTADDYRDVALKYPGVRQAAATLRWTGSWYSVFLTIEREAGVMLDQGFIAALEAFIDGYRMVGYDLQVEDANRVPLFIQMHVCIEDGFVAADIEKLILATFSNQILPDGTRGAFYPDNLDLGQPLYLSPLYARAQAIEGVASVTIERFERASNPFDPTGLQEGVLIPNRLELFELDNDPNFPERGQFKLIVDGGL